MLIDREMQQLVNTWVPFGTPMEKAAVPEHMQMALATGKPQVTGLFTGPVTRQLMFGIVVPVEIEGERLYALVRSPISMPSQVLSRQMSCRPVGMRWFPTPRTKSSRGLTRRRHSSGRTCRRRSGIAQPPAAYSNLSTLRAAVAGAYAQSN